MTSSTALYMWVYTAQFTFKERLTKHAHGNIYIQTAISPLTQMTKTCVLPLFRLFEVLIKWSIIQRTNLTIFSISRDLAQCERGLRGWDPCRVWYSISNTTEIFYTFANGLSSDPSPSLYYIYSSIHTFYLWPQLEYISVIGALEYIE